MYVCVIVVCVQEGSNMCDWLKFCKLCTYARIMLCTDYVHITGNTFVPHAFLCTRKYRFVVRIKILNTELRVCNLLHEGILLYLWYTALITLLTIINSNDRNTTFMVSIKFMIPTVLVKKSFNYHWWSHHVSPAQVYQVGQSNTNKGFSSLPHM